MRVLLEEIWSSLRNSLGIKHVFVDDHMLLEALIRALLLHSGDVLDLEINNALGEASLLHLLQVVGDRIELVCLVGWDGIHYFRKVCEFVNLINISTKTLWKPNTITLAIILGDAV